MNRLSQITLCAVTALGCAACASVDSAGGNGWSTQAQATHAPGMQPVSMRLPEEPAAEWQFNPYPPNDDDGYEMPPVVPLEP